MRRVEFRAMGSSVRLIHSGDHEADEIEPAIESVFRQYERRFQVESLGTEFRDVTTGALPLSTASAALRDAVDFAVLWRDRAASKHGAKRDGSLRDLSGAIAAMSLDSAGALLDDAGIQNWLLHCGASVLVRGTDEGGSPWRSQIAHPHSPSSTMALELRGTNRALQTRMARGSAPDAPGFEQVTVVGGDILSAEHGVGELLGRGPARFVDLTDELGVDAIALEGNGLTYVTPGALESVTFAESAWLAALRPRKALALQEG